MEVSPLNADTIDSYNKLDDTFFERFGPEGDSGRRLRLNPTIFRLLGDPAGKRILDAGCGNGYLSRLLAERGAEVVGVEPASAPLAHAVRVEDERRQGIVYLRQDLSRLSDVGRPFDAVVANMVLLDIADWRPALANCVGVLRRGGTLVYSLTHPVWVNGRFAEWAEKGHVEISEYLDEYQRPGDVGVHFHRPISVYLNETIRLGCRILEVAEPKLLPHQVERPEFEIFTRLPNFIVIAAARD